MQSMYVKKTPTQQNEKERINENDSRKYNDGFTIKSDVRGRG